MTLDEMQQAWLEFRRERNWEQFHDPKSQAIGLVLEAAEVAEHMQWHTGDDLQKLLDENKDKLGEELVDVLSWVLLIAADQGIDLPAAFEAKMKKNAAKYPVEKSTGKATKYTNL
ncbi:MAG: nucleotide pyrophosphohydrolase [Planctomycetota bacterium]